MTVTKVHYSVLVSLGDYNNERIGFVKEVKPGDNAEDAINELRELAKACGCPRLKDLYNAQSKALEELRQIERKLKNKTEEWNAMASFLQAQGIKTDAKMMPDFSKLLAPATETEEIETETIDADTADIEF